MDAIKRTVTTLLLVALAAVAAMAGVDVEAAKRMYEERDYDGARAAFQSILAEHNDHHEALYYLGRIELDHWDLDAAREFLERLVEVAPESAGYRLRLGEVYSQKARTSGFFMTKKSFAGKWKEQLETAFALAPELIEARERLARYLLVAPGIGGGDKDRGTRIARETVEIDEIRGRLLLAYAYNRTGDLAASDDEARRVLQANPDNAYAHKQLGLNERKRKNAAAEEHLLRFVKLAPENANAHVVLADYYDETGQLRDAATEYEKALALDPLLSEARFELAEAYEELEMGDRAAEHYEQLVALTPKHFQADQAAKRLEHLRRHGHPVANGRARASDK